MTNIERLKLETTGIWLTDEQYSMYLLEAGVTEPEAEYNPQSNQNKRQIYMAALSILNSTANNPTLMKNYKEDDMTVTGFAESLQARINQIEYLLRMMPIEGTSSDSKSARTFFLFQS